MNERHQAALREARQWVEQWDKHDRHRVTEADKVLWNAGLGEPDEVAIARALIDTHEHLEQFASYVATCRQRNTREWLEGLLDKLQAVAERVSPETLFRLTNVGDFVIRKKQGSER